jgi:acyl-CoA thioesterase-1
LPFILLAMESQTKMIRKIIATVIVLALVISGTLGYTLYSAFKLPENHPGAYQKSVELKEKIVVCMGDSITHGRVSHNYVDELSTRFADQGFRFVNAGINGQLAYNLVQRVDPIVEIDPDYITILIGTNDVLGTLSQAQADQYISSQSLPQAPDREWYEANLTQLVEGLQSRTKAKIALISLPPVTENPSHRGYTRAAEYSEFVRRLAEQHNLTYLPLNEQLDEKLKEKIHNPPQELDLGTMTEAIFRHYALVRDWDEVADANDMAFLTDGVHLSKRGASVVTDLIGDFLTRPLE